MKKSLFMLDCVIPMIMNVIHDFGGYVEKNTGDGVMAILGIEEDDDEGVNVALDIATTSLYVIKNLVNPFLESFGVSNVNMTVGIDLGTLLIARIGVPTGSAKVDRSFLTAVGPSANPACHIQQMAGENEIWVGDNIYTHAMDYRKGFFYDKTPVGWIWTYKHDASIPYKIWHYDAYRVSLS